MSAPVGKGLGEPRDGERLLYRGRASWNIEQGTFEGRTDKGKLAGLSNGKSRTTRSGNFELSRLFSRRP